MTIDSERSFNAYFIPPLYLLVTRQMTNTADTSTLEEAVLGFP